MAAKVDAAGRRVKRAGEPKLAMFADKDITPVIQGFADWLTEQTGYEVDPKSVYLGSALRGTFQKSPENQERIHARQIELEQERKDRAERIATRAAKAAEPAAAKPAKAPKAAPVKAAAKAARTTKATAKTAPAATTRRRPAKSKGGDTEDF